MSGLQVQFNSQTLMLVSMTYAIGYCVSALNDTKAIFRHIHFSDSRWFGWTARLRSQPRKGSWDQRYENQISREWHSKAWHSCSAPIRCLLDRRSQAQRQTGRTWEAANSIRAITYLPTWQRLYDIAMRLVHVIVCRAILSNWISIGPKSS